MTFHAPLFCCIAIRMQSVEEPLVLYPPRFRMAAVALGMMALAVLLLWDVPDIYDGLIRGDKFKWLLDLPPLARACLMGGLGVFILLAAVYLMIWVLFAKPAKISKEGIEAYPRIFWRSYIRWDEAAVIEVRKDHVIIRSNAGSHSSPVVRIPLRLGRTLNEILSSIARYRPDLTRPHSTEHESK